MAKNDDELNEDKKEEKKKKRSEEKEKSGSDESAGSKIVSILIVIVIILIWLGVFAALIKADVGGFGSKVLAPVLEDVPVVNKILPEGSAGSSDSDYDYDLDEAIDRIKELEMELDSKNSTSGVDSNYIAQLEAEIERLQVFEKEQEKFAKEKKEFDEQVVYADNAPSIEEYKKYYEEMNPDNAAEIYRQVVEEVQYNAKVTSAAERYAQMDPASAATILSEMTAADLELVCAIVDSMPSEQSALVLQAMDSNIAAKITKRMLAKDE